MSGHIAEVDLIAGGSRNAEVSHWESANIQSSWNHESTKGVVFSCFRAFVIRIGHVQKRTEDRLPTTDSGPNQSMSGHIAEVDLIAGNSKKTDVTLGKLRTFRWIRSSYS